MKKFEFRGRDSSGWVYGYLINDHMIGECDPSTALEDVSVVDPLTVGRFTGLLDKNNKEIYEGDIIRTTLYNETFPEGLVGFIRYEAKWATFYLAIKNSFGVGVALDNVWSWFWDEGGEIVAEVIGNLYENPELLED